MKIEVVEKIQNILWGIIGTSLVLANFLDNDIFIGILLVALILAMLFCMETVAQAKVLVDEKGTESEICSEVVFDGETYLKSQRYDDIYENGDQYVMIVTDEDNSEELTVIPMERKDINFDDEDAVEMFLNRKDIPKE